MRDEVVYREGVYREGVYREGAYRGGVSERACREGVTSVFPIGAIGPSAPEER